MEYGPRVRITGLLVVKERANEPSQNFLKNVKVDLPYDLAIPHLGIYLREVKTEPQKDLPRSDSRSVISKSLRTENKLDVQ